MTINEMFIKGFKKSTAVIIEFIHEEGRKSVHWCVPAHDNTVKIPTLNRGAIISRDHMYLTTKWNIPTYTVHHSNCESMSLEDIRKSEYTSEELFLILNNQEAHKVYQASKKGVLSNESMILLVAMVVGFVLLFYFFNTKLDVIDQKVTEPVPIVETIEDAENIEE